MWVEVVCKVRKEGRTVSDVIADLGSLKEKGLQTVSATGHVRVLAEEGKNNPCDAVMLSEIEEGLQEACGGHPHARIMEWEHGGGLPRSGDAVCVAGLQGESLRPLVIPRGDNLVNGNHALFASRDGLVIAHVTRDEDDMKINLHRYALDGRLGLIEEEELWTSSFPDVLRGGVKSVTMLGDFPMDLDWAFPVISAATRKAWRWHCRDAFYYFEERNRE